MPKFRVHQIRSGEGWILSDPDLVSAADLATDLSDLITGHLLVATESDAAPALEAVGGRRVKDGLWAFSGAQAQAMLRDWKRWGARRALFACLPALPDEDALRRWIPDVMRPWDPERLKATAYGQLGREWAQRGLWFASERDRSRYLELAVTRLMTSRDARLPNGDVTLVLEMPTDSTFDATFDVSGTGTGTTLRREFPSRESVMEWTIRTGEWEAVERRSSRPSASSLRSRLTQGLATTGIIVLSIPVFVMMILVALIAKITGSATSVSASTKAGTR